MCYPRRESLADSNRAKPRHLLRSQVYSFDKAISKEMKNVQAHNNNNNNEQNISNRATNAIINTKSNRNNNKSGNNYNGHKELDDAEG